MQRYLETPVETMCSAQAGTSLVPEHGDGHGSPMARVQLGDSPRSRECYQGGVIQSARWLLIHPVS